MLKKITTLLLTLTIFAAPLMSTAADARQDAIDQSMTYYKTELKEHFNPDSSNKPKFTANVWTMLDLFVTDNVNNDDFNFLKPDVIPSNLNNESTPNEYASAIICLYAEGKSSSYPSLPGELAALIMNNGEISDSVELFELAMSVLALEIAGNTDYSKDKVVKFFADAWLKDGGFNYYSDEGDIDTTAIIIIALAAIRTAAASELIEKSFGFLRELQQDDGFFLAKHEFASKNASSQSMAIMAIIAAAEKLSDWNKNGVSPVDALLTLKGENGGFWNSAADKAGEGWIDLPDSTSTSFAILALNAAINDKTIFDKLLPIEKYKKPITSTVPVSSVQASSSAAASSEKSNPVTGDPMKMLPWIIVIVLAVIALAAAIFLGKGKKK